MDGTLFNPDTLTAWSRGGTVVIFAFMRAVSIMLRRFVAAHPSGDFSNICIVALPIPDVLPRAGGRDEIDAVLEKTGEVVRCGPRFTRWGGGVPIAECRRA